MLVLPQNFRLEQQPKAGLAQFLPGGQVLYGPRLSGLDVGVHDGFCLKPQFRSRSEEHTSELQSQSNLVCRLLLEKKKKNTNNSEGQVDKTGQYLAVKTDHSRAGVERVQIVNLVSGGTQNLVDWAPDYNT